MRILLNDNFINDNFIALSMLGKMMYELYSLQYTTSIIGIHNDLVIFKNSMIKMHKSTENNGEYSNIQKQYTRYAKTENVYYTEIYEYKEREI